MLFSIFINLNLQSQLHSTWSISVRFDPIWCKNTTEDKEGILHYSQWMTPCKKSSTSTKIDFEICVEPKIMDIKPHHHGGMKQIIRNTSTEVGLLDIKNTKQARVMATRNMKNSIILSVLRTVLRQAPRIIASPKFVLLGLKAPKDDLHALHQNTIMNWC